MTPEEGIGKRNTAAVVLVNVVYVSIIIEIIIIIDRDSDNSIANKRTFNIIN